MISRNGPNPILRVLSALPFCPDSVSCHADCRADPRIVLSALQRSSSIILSPRRNDQSPETTRRRYPPFLVAYITECELSLHIYNTRSSTSVHYLTSMALASSSFLTTASSRSFDPFSPSLCKSSSLTMSSRLAETSGIAFSTKGPKTLTCKRNLRARRLQGEAGRTG